MLSGISTFSMPHNSAWKSSPGGFDAAGLCGHFHVHTHAQTNTYFKDKGLNYRSRRWRADCEVCRSCLSRSRDSRTLFWDKVTKALFQLLPEDTGLHMIILGLFPEYEHQS